MITPGEEAMEAWETLQHSHAESVFGVRLGLGRNGALIRASILMSYAHFKMALCGQATGEGKDWQRR
jgi:hypothetical protein